MLHQFAKLRFNSMKVRLKQDDETIYMNID